MYIENNIRIVEMRLESFTAEVNHEITVDNLKPIDYECLCGEVSTQELHIPDGTMCDYVNFFTAINAAIDYGEPVIVKKLVYKPDTIEKALLVVTM